MKIFLQTTKAALPYKSLLAGLLASAIALTPSYAAIDNTVTVTGKDPDGSDVPSATATESVDVESANAKLTMTKTSDASGAVNVGDTINYTYSVKNDGNVTVSDVTVADNQEGNGTLTTITLSSTQNGVTSASSDAGDDQDWDKLAPGETVVWTASYTITQADMDDNGGGDGKLANAASVSGNYTGSGGSTETVSGGTTDNTAESGEGLLTVSLANQSASLEVTKTAFIGSGTESKAAASKGDVITYTYVIKNDGNVTITGIAISDSHNGTDTDNPPVPNIESATLNDLGTTSDSSNSDTSNGLWDSLAPGDELTLTATYTVTQEDVDTLQ